MLRISALAGIGGAVAMSIGSTASASADTISPQTPGSLGVLLDYSAGVLQASDLKASGAVGAIRYVSDHLPQSTWAVGKPMQASEAQQLQAAGLAIVSNYEYGDTTNQDWMGGLAGGVQHAQRGLAQHKAVGGPDTAPIYASIDANPSTEQILTVVIPYIKGWESVLGHGRVGVYANSPTIDALVQAGLGSFYWQHGWGTPQGYVHPAAHLRQSVINANKVAGVGVDVNDILKASYGQWGAGHPSTTGQAPLDPQDVAADQAAISKGLGLAQQVLGQLTQQ